MPALCPELHFPVLPFSAVENHHSLSAAQPSTRLHVFLLLTPRCWSPHSFPQTLRQDSPQLLPLQTLQPFPEQRHRPLRMPTPTQLSAAFFWFGFPSLGTGPDVMVSDCRRGEQLADCSHTQASPVSGFWIFYQCCFTNFCNNPKNRRSTMH